MIAFAFPGQFRVIINDKLLSYFTVFIFFRNEKISKQLAGSRLIRHANFLQELSDSLTEIGL